MILPYEIIKRMAWAFYAPQMSKSSGEAVLISSDSILLGGLQKNTTGFQFLELGAPSSSMALSYDHFGA